MKKSKQEIKAIANQISSQEGKYLFNLTEICKMVGVSAKTGRKICENLVPVTHGSIKRYYILDVLEYLYSEKN